MNRIKLNAAAEGRAGSGGIYEKGGRAGSGEAAYIRKAGRRAALSTSERAAGRGGRRFLPVGGALEGRREDKGLTLSVKTPFYGCIGVTTYFD